MPMVICDNEYSDCDEEEILPGEILSELLEALLIFVS
jgi:hypothetical protein